MKKHGIHKVRDGSYSQLDAVPVQNLTRQIRHAEDVCLRCHLYINKNELGAALANARSQRLKNNDMNDNN